MGFLTGKRALITGIASDRSIAYGIAEAMHREGAELAFTYQNDKLKSRVEKLAAAFGSSIVIHCDVATDGQHRGGVHRTRYALGWRGHCGSLHCFRPQRTIEWEHRRQYHP